MGGKAWSRSDQGMPERTRSREGAMEQVAGKSLWKQKAGIRAATGEVSDSGEMGLSQGVKMLPAAQWLRGRGARGRGEVAA